MSDPNWHLKYQGYQQDEDGTWYRPAQGLDWVTIVVIVSVVIFGIIIIGGLINSSNSSKEKRSCEPYFIRLLGRPLQQSDLLDGTYASLTFEGAPGPCGVCNIKGNSDSGIYHTPGDSYYWETVAEEYFCTEAEARAAGYRRALR